MLTFVGNLLACCSFQCLKMSNFISFPNIEIIQALIMLVNFLRNQADAGASWSVLGKNGQWSFFLSFSTWTAMPNADDTQD